MFVVLKLLFVHSELDVGILLTVLFVKELLVLEHQTNTIFSIVLKICGKKETINFIMSVHPSLRLSAWNNSAPTVRIFFL